MKHLKPVDKAMFCMVSEFAGRNESECIGSLVILKPMAEFLCDVRRQHSDPILRN